MQSQYDREISSTPTGYKTELTSGRSRRAPSRNALNALAVIDTLGPLYYENKPADASAKKPA